MAGPGSGPFFEQESFPNEDVEAEFKLRIRVLLANLSNRAIFSPHSLHLSMPGYHEVRLAEFAAWALSIGWGDMPPELVALAQPRKAPATTGKSVSISPVRICEGESVPGHTPKQQLQEETILAYLSKEYGDPKALPKPLPGTRGPKAAAWLSMADNKRVFQSQLVFNKAWERLRANGDIQDEK